MKNFRTKILKIIKELLSETHKKVQEKKYFLNKNFDSCIRIVNIHDYYSYINMFISVNEKKMFLVIFLSIKCLEANSVLQEAEIF